MTRVWAGVDCGKARRHCVVIDGDGRRLLSRRVANDEPHLLAVLADVRALADQVTWAVDLPDGGAALLIGLLVAADQPVLYLPGRAVNRASGTYRDRTRVINRLRGLRAQAVLALARRRVNVLWALIRENRTYQATPPLRAAA